MKKLFHLSTTPRQLSMFEEDWEAIQEFVNKHQMDGIEVGLTLDYDIDKIPNEIIEGVHLSFYPMWLDFWRQDQEKLSQLFASKEEEQAYYKGDTPASLIENYKKQYERAKKLGAKYMVFHVSHALPQDTFTWEFDYSDKEVMQATLELVNAAFPKESEGPLLLFENLWWPGLNYKDPELTRWFIEQVEYPNKGYLVDVSHLILNNSSIGTEAEAYDYIQETIEALGEARKWIKAVHLNKTLPKNYMRRNHQYTLEKYLAAPDSRRRLGVLKKHIQALDGHQPFAHPIAKKIIQLINPEYCVFETAPQSRYELAYFIKQQNEALK